MKLKQFVKNRGMLLAYTQILLGCIIGGAAYPLFLVPNSIAPGGLTGVSTILNHLFQWHVGVTSLLMNIPLFVLGWKSMGKSFAIRSLIATVLFSECIDLLQLKPMTDEPLLGSLYGGVLLGAGIGLIIRGGATTGGTDMIARMVHRRFPSMSTGTLLFVLDCVVVLCAAVFVGVGAALYSLICIFVTGKVVDMVIIGTRHNEACFIISDQWEAITDQLLHRLDRGVTQLTARGGFTGCERPMVLCIVPLPEVAMIKAMVREIDPNAFMFVTEAREAVGEGFAGWTEDQG